MSVYIRKNFFLFMLLLALISQLLLETFPLCVRTSVSASPASWAWPGMRYLIHRPDHRWFECSVGFPAQDSAGNHYFITAGHCFRSDDISHHYMRDARANRTLEIYSDTDQVHPVGFEKIYMTPDNKGFLDISLVQMYPGAHLAGRGFTHIPHALATGATRGSSSLGAHLPACFVGERNNKASCGVIYKTRVSSRFRGFAYPDWDLTLASYCALPGDSGGAVFNDHYALGINVGGMHNFFFNNQCTSAYVPIEDVLSVFRKSIPSLTI